MAEVKFSELIKKFEPKEIYTGLEEGCRCGCHGRYFKHGDVGFKRALNKAMKLDPTVQTFEWTYEMSAATTKVRKGVRDDGTARAYAYLPPDRPSAWWIDIVLDGRPLKTITVYNN